MEKSQSFSQFEITLMRRLFKLAATKKGISNPNPVVAAAVVKDEHVIGIGVHDQYGTPHAEALAIKAATGNTQGSKIYVTLEPCTHWGKNPPCVDLIRDAGITEVVFAITDPNPKVRKSAAQDRLNAAGISVRHGILQEEAKQLNEVFFKNQTMNLPFVLGKYAMSLDGKIALANGESKYLTGEKARKDVHKLRREVDGILVGIGTVLKDDPCLNVRFGLLKGGYKNPKKIILDSQLRISETAKLFEKTEKKNIFIITSLSAQNPIIEKKATVLRFPIEQKSLSFWPFLLKTLYEHGIKSLMIEGGSTVLTSAIEADIIDKLIVYTAPKLLVGRNAMSPIVGQDFSDLSEAKIVSDLSVKKLGHDIRITAYF